jgi:hypothetical protein
MDGEQGGHLAHWVAGPQQPQRMQPRAQGGVAFPLIERAQRRYIFLPGDHQRRPRGIAPPPQLGLPALYSLAISIWYKPSWKGYLITRVTFCTWVRLPPVPCIVSV